MTVIRARMPVGARPLLCWKAKSPRWIRVAYRLALIDLYLAEGTLLSRRGLVVD